MTSRRQAAVDKLDRTITRLYTYLSGSEGEEGEPSPNQRRTNPRPIQRYQEPEYQQPYAFPQPHPVPYNPYGQTNFALGLVNDTPTSDPASDVTFTESELALQHEATLPMHNGE